MSFIVYFRKKTQKKMQRKNKKEQSENPLKIPPTKVKKSKEQRIEKMLETKNLPHQRTTRKMYSRLSKKKKRMIMVPTLKLLLL